MMAFDWMAAFLANRGYAVLQPNFRGSTGYGVKFEEAGYGQWGLKMQDDLSEGVKKLVADGIADPKRNIVGEIHSYVGDELIATWKLAEGVSHAHCVSACFAAMERLARLAPEYVREFGAAANFRAGLHCGPVVTGEMGSVKKEIVFLGDTVNTTARIQEMCRQTGDRVLASADLIDRLELPFGVAKRSLGGLRLRGKENDVALYALTRTTADVVQLATRAKRGR